MAPGRWLAAPLAVAGSERVRQNPVKPGLRTGARPQLMERRVRPSGGFLHQVLGVGRVVSHPQRDPVELSEDRYDIAFKPLVTADKLLLVAPGVADGHRRPTAPTVTVT